MRQHLLDGVTKQTVFAVKQLADRATGELAGIAPARHILVGLGDNVELAFAGLRRKQAGRLGHQHHVAACLANAADQPELAGSRFERGHVLLPNAW